MAELCQTSRHNLWYDITVTPTHLHILAQLGEDSVIGAEPVYGRDGLSGVVLSDGNSFFFASDSDPESWGEFVGELVMKHKRIAVWDLRRFGFWAFDDDLIIWDVKSLNGGEIGIQELSRSLSRDDNVYARFIELDQRVIAHSRAAKTARLDVDARLITPTSLLVEWAKSKVSVIRALYIAGLDKFYDEYASRWPFIRALRDSELSGIHVDVSFITATLAGDVDTVTHRTLCSMRDLQVGGLVSTFLNPIGGKTGRLRHEGGFNSLGIPHGPARNAITSRYEGGKIVSLDFNAIDYRCIVKAIGGEVAKLYDGAADFHQRTASFIFKDVTPSNRDS